MKKTFYKSGLVAFAAMALLTSCDPEIDAPGASAGEANFERYVAVGNSLTAGYADNGLYRKGQMNSYPSILADQFKLAGGGEFVQPLFTENQKNGSGYLSFAGFDAAGNPRLVPVTTELAIRGFNSSGGPLYTKFTEPVNNYGVPGIRVSDIKTPGYGSQAGNPYFERITPDGTPLQTYLQRVSASNPTFFTNWLGNNDVLGFATAGGMNGTAAITAEGTFKTNYDELVAALTSNNAKGVLATLPDVTLVPFFTTVGPTLKKTATDLGIPAVVALTGSGNSRLPIPRAAIKDASGGTVLFTLTSSPYLPLLGRPTGKYWRDFANTNKVPLAAVIGLYGVDTTKMFGLSVENPLPSSFLLDDTELGQVKDATTKFNNIIREAATRHNLALFDVNPFFQSIQPVDGKAQLVINQVSYTPAFISGNIFSLDGVHLTPRGYAIVANEFITRINAKYNAKIPTVNVNNYDAIRFPN